MNTADTFETIWSRLVIPAEYDSMDECDQARWKMALRQAYKLGRGGVATAADTYAYAIRKPAGTLYGQGRYFPPALWNDAEIPTGNVSRYSEYADCTVVKVRITTDLGETQ